MLFFYSRLYHYSWHYIIHHVALDFLKNYYCALLMMTTNGSLTQSVQEILNNNFVYGHVKFSFRILCHKHRTTPLPTMSALVFYNHSIPRLWSLSMLTTSLSSIHCHQQGIYWGIHGCSKRSDAICAGLIWHDLRLTWGGHFITTSFRSKRGHQLERAYWYCEVTVSKAPRNDIGGERWSYSQMTAWYVSQGLWREWSYCPGYQWWSRQWGGGTQ